MSDKKALIEAIELFKEFRNHAQAVSDAQLELISFMINKVSALAKKPVNERSVEDNAVLDFYYSFIDKVSSSLDKNDEYNKSLSKYVRGLKVLNKIASSKDENN